MKVIIFTPYCILLFIQYKIQRGLYIAAPTELPFFYRVKVSKKIAFNQCPLEEVIALCKDLYLVCASSLLAVDACGILHHHKFIPVKISSALWVVLYSYDDSYTWLRSIIDHRHHRNTWLSIVVHYYKTLQLNL